MFNLIRNSSLRIAPGELVRLRELQLVFGDRSGVQFNKKFFITDCTRRAREASGAPASFSEIVQVFNLIRNSLLRIAPGELVRPRELQQGFK